MEADAQERLARAEAALAEARRVGSGERAVARAEAQAREQTLLAEANAAARRRWPTRASGWPRPSPTERAKLQAQSRATRAARRRARSWAARWRREVARDGWSCACWRWRSRRAVAVRTHEPSTPPRLRARARGHGSEPRRSRRSSEHAAAGDERAAGTRAPRSTAASWRRSSSTSRRWSAILVLRRPQAINKALLARHQQLKAELAAAAEVRAAAEARLAKQEKRLASLEHEIAAMRAGIKQEAEAEKPRLIAAAEERARRIQDETKFLLDQQVKEAEVELRREAARRRRRHRPSSWCAVASAPATSSAWSTRFVADVRTRAAPDRAANPGATV